MKKEIDYMEAIRALEKFRMENEHAGQLPCDDFYTWCCHQIAARDHMTPLKK